MSQNSFDVLRQSHHLSQCWPRFMLWNGISRPQWVNLLHAFFILKKNKHSFAFFLSIYHGPDFIRYHCNSEDDKVQVIYRKISNIRRTKSPNLNASRLVLQFSLPNPMKPGVKSRMKMQLEQRRQAMLQLHLCDRQYYLLPTKVRLILETWR